MGTGKSIRQISRSENLYGTETVVTAKFRGLIYSENLHGIETIVIAKFRRLIYTNINYMPI